MDRPLLFLVLALVAVGVFLFLRRQDDAEKVPPPGTGAPYDPGAAARIQEVDEFVTDLTRRFAEFDTLSPVLPQDSVAGITEILGEIVQIRAELNAVDVDAESSTRKAVLARLDTFARTVEKVVRSAKVDRQEWLPNRPKPRDLWYSLRCSPRLPPRRSELWSICLAEARPQSPCSGSAT